MQDSDHGITISTFAQHFEDNREMLERLAFFSVRDMEAARDIVGGLFLKVWEKHDSLTPEKILPYLITSVRNAALNYRRDSSIHREVYNNIERKERGVMEYYTKAMENAAPSELLTREILDICHRCLAKLPPEVSCVYSKSRIEGLTYKEIAEVMDISVKRVDHDMQLALKSLKLALGDYLGMLAFCLGSTAV